MKMKNVFVLIAAALLVSCSKGEIEQPVDMGSNEIVLRSSIVGVEASSRAAYEGTDLENNPLEALVLASIVDGNYNTLHCYGTMRFDGSTTGTAYNKTGLRGSYRYPSGTANVYLTGIHPAEGWTGVGGTTEIPTLTDGKLSFTLTGKDDVMFAGQQSTRLNDVTASTPSYAELEFRHQLTLMKLSLYCDVTAADKIKVQSMQLIKANKADLKSKVTTSLNTTQGISFAVPSTAVALNCYQTDSDDVYSFDSDEEYLVTTTAAEQAYVLAPPVVASSSDEATGEYTFRIAYLDGTNSKTKDVDVDLKSNQSTLFTGSTANKAFSITLKFVDGEIVANATIVDWETGGTFEQDI